MLARGRRGRFRGLRPLDQGQELVVEVVVMVEAPAEAHPPPHHPAAMEVDDGGGAAHPQLRSGLAGLARADLVHHGQTARLAGVLGDAGRGWRAGCGGGGAGGAFRNRAHSAWGLSLVNGTDLDAGRCLSILTAWRDGFSRGGGSSRIAEIICSDSRRG